MSANLLNFATLPGPGGSAAAASGGAAPSATGGKGGASSPLTGFEALLAGLFGDQGVGTVTPTPAGDGKAGPGSKAATAPTTARAGQGADTGVAPPSDTASTTGPDGASTTVPDAVLALLVPVPTLALVGDTATAATPAPGGEAAKGSAALEAGSATLPQLADTVLTGDTAIAGSGQPGVSKASSLPAALSAGATAMTGDPAAAARPDKPPLLASPAALTSAGASAQDALAVQAAAAAAAQAKVADPISPGAREIAAKSAGQAAKPPGLEAPRVDAAASPLAARPGDGLQVSSSSAGGGGLGGGSGSGSADREARPASTEIRNSTPDAAPVAGGLDTQSTTTPATLSHAAAILRGSPQTVASLAAQIARKLDGRSSRFDVQLDPAGLGKVDVRIEIGASGRMTAAMSFDTPQAAAELRARAGELQKALEQAGFDLSGGMSFDVAGDGGRGAQDRQNAAGQSGGATFRGRAFQVALDAGGEAAASNSLNLRRAASDSVDIRI